MKVILQRVVVHLDRHERFESVFVFDDHEYRVPHTDVRVKARLLNTVPGSMFEAELVVDTSRLVIDETISEGEEIIHEGWMKPGVQLDLVKPSKGE